jgi:hypothetical protein
MAEKDDKLIIEIELDDGKLAKGFVKTQDVAKRAGKKSGDDFGNGAYKGATLGLNKLRSTLLGIGATLAGAFAGRQVIAAAQVQEDAVNQLNASLRNLGQYTPQLSSELQKFASSLQETTIHGDEAILKQLAFAQAMGATVAQSKKIVGAATDMAAALNIDLNSAVRNITRTLGGMPGEMGKIIPSLKALTKAQLMAGQGVDLLSKKYEGFGGAQTQTFSGSMKQLKNAFGDLLEEIGALVTKSPTVIAAFKFISKQVKEAIQSVNKFGSQGDVFKPILMGLISFGEGVNLFLIAPLELAFNLIRAGFNTSAAVLNGLVAFYGQILGKIGDLANKAGLNNGVTQALQDFRASSASVFTGAVTDAQNAWDNIFEFNQTDRADQFLQKFKESVQGAEAVALESGENIKRNISTGPKELPFTFANIMASVAAELNKFETKTAAFAKRIADVLKQGIGGGAANAFASLGKAAVEGENMLKSFLDSFLASMGQMAIQLGSMFMLEGAAMMWAGLPNGGPLIAAGAALAAIGGVMGAVFGNTAKSGSASVPIATSGSSPGNPSFTEDVSTVAPEIHRDTSPTINVNIQGDVLDGQESGRRIVDIINDAFGREGVRINRGVLA